MLCTMYRVQLHDSHCALCRGEAGHGTGKEGQCSNADIFAKPGHAEVAPQSEHARELPVQVEAIQGVSPPPPCSGLWWEEHLRMPFPCRKGTSLMLCSLLTFPIFCVDADRPR